MLLPPAEVPTAPSLGAHLNKLTCPSVRVEHASIILCGWNAVAAIGVGRCDDNTFVWRKLLKGSIVDRGLETASGFEPMDEVLKRRIALCEEPLVVMLASWCNLSMICMVKANEKKILDISKSVNGYRLPVTEATSIRFAESNCSSQVTPLEGRGK